MANIRESLKIAGAFVGVIVGAGFASGQEIMQFFTSFGTVGLAGAVISSALFIFLAMALSTLGQHQSGTSHKTAITAICGRHLGLLVDWMITFFMFAITVVMFAGAGSLLEQLTGLPSLWGSIGATVLVIAIVCLDVNKVIGFVSLLTVPLLLVTAVVAALAISGQQLDVAALDAAAASQPRGAPNWLLAAVLYVSYNIVAGAPFLVIMGGRAVDRGTALWGGVLGGIALGLLMLLIAGGMFARVNELSGVAMPMLMLAQQSSPLVGWFMGLTIFAMILNTSVGVLYSFSARVFTPGTRTFQIGTVIAGIAAFGLSFIGFIKLIGTVYPFFGYLGFFLMAATVLAWWRIRGKPSDMAAAH